MSKIAKAFTRVDMIQIGENALLHGVVKALEGRETFIDTDDTMGERIYTGDVFAAILGEDSQAKKGGHKGITDAKVLEQLNDLNDNVDSAYIQIVMI